MRFVTGGGLRIDYLITHRGEARTELIGGNALYAAVGTALWTGQATLWARTGENYPRQWLHELQRHGIDTGALVTVPGHHDHRTFYAYTAAGRRVDTEPARHFARIGQPLPPALRDYVHSTPGQEAPNQFEPLALRPTDWPGFGAEDVAVHLSPLALATHLHVPPQLRAAGVRQITADPGERYMIPARRPFIRALLPRLDAFLPSDMEVRSLFGAAVDLREAAAQLCAWGAPVVVVKNGPRGVLVQQGANGRCHRLPAYHAPGDPRVVDVTGAGDAFCGGFMVGLAQTADPLHAARLGLVSASFVIEGYGALYALRYGRAAAEARLAELTA